MEKNQNIQTLEIMHTKAKNNMVKLLGDAISKNSSLKHLNLFNIDRLTDSFSDLINGMILNQSIETLKLDFNDLDDEHCELLSSYLSKNQMLKELSLEENSITEQGMKLLKGGLMNHNSLKILNLSGNPIEGYSSLRDLLSNTKLETLFISKCKIKEEGLIKIFEALQYNTTLTEFHFNKNNQEENFQEIKDLLFFNTRIIKMKPLFKEFVERNLKFKKVLKLHYDLCSNVHFNFQ